jgi:small subunit ribosomal protein S3
VGQKVNPIGLRVGIIQDWRSKWFAEKKEFGKSLGEDLAIRKYVKKKLYHSGVSKIVIEKSSDKVRITIMSARPGIIIGRRGEAIDKLKEELRDFTSKEVHIDIEEVKTPEIDAQLVSENIATQLEKRIAFKRAMKKAISQAMSSGAKGIKIKVGGRLGGAEIARCESYKEGKIPLQTLRADIDYGFAIAFTTYGTIGVKVWIYKGDVFPKKKSMGNRIEVKTTGSVAENKE